MDVPQTKLEHHASMPNKIELQYLKTITNEFSKDLILGSGGFGTVYKVCHSFFCIFFLIHSTLNYAVTD
jgi:hypothetical protein